MARRYGSYGLCAQSAYVLSHLTKPKTERYAKITCTLAQFQILASMKTIVVRKEFF